MFKELNKKNKKYFLSDSIEVRDSDLHGVGVFATKVIEKHTIIEACPVILFSKDTMTVLRDLFETRHILMDYPFAWDHKQFAFALGYGGIYNHSSEPNARWNCNYENKTLEFRTLRDIKPGEELLTSYVPKSIQTHLWF